MINHEFSKTSEKNLKGVHKDLSDVMRRALKLSPIDFGISEGLRNQKRQLELLAFMHNMQTTSKSCLKMKPELKFSISHSLLAR